MCSSDRPTRAPDGTSGFSASARTRTRSHLVGPGATASGWAAVVRATFCSTRPFSVRISIRLGGGPSQESWLNAAVTFRGVTGRPKSTLSHCPTGPCQPPVSHRVQGLPSIAAYGRAPGSSSWAIESMSEAEEDAVTSLMPV